MELRTRIIPRQLQFKQPAKTSRGVYLRKQVWYVVVSGKEQGKSFLGIGECAPLYDLSPDFSEHYENHLRYFCKELERSGGIINIEELRPFPSILFGLETAMLSAKASLRGDYLKLYDTPFCNGLCSIPINGLVWMGNYEEMQQRIDEKLSNGYTCIKLKIGAIDFDSETQLIKKIRSRYSKEDITIRLDANGAFSITDALSKLQILSKWDIHSIEQPIQPGHWDEMSKLCKETPIPIALDEELIGVNTLEEKKALLETITPHYIILKPTLHGGLYGAEEWIAEAYQRNISHWVTSALESNVGLNAIAGWCSQPHILTSMPQGLGTGQLFTENFSETRLTIENGQLWNGCESERVFNRMVAGWIEEWHNPTPTTTLYSSGSTGKSHAFQAEKLRMKASAEATIKALHLSPKDTALLCLPVEHIAGKMMVVRAIIGKLNLVIRKPTSRPLKGLRLAPYFAAMTPMQVCESLKYAKDRRLLRSIHTLLIGGGPISPSLNEALKDFPGEIWSSYGMTETLSHIALQRLNGKSLSEGYTPLDGVNVKISEKGCLVIEAPRICNEPIITCDLAKIQPDGTFLILGRSDNTICSGALKYQVEELEAKLSKIPIPFLITATPHATLGEAITLLYEGTSNDETILREHCRKLLTRYELPRHYICVPQLPRTDNGKPARKEAKRIALEYIKANK